MNWLRNIASNYLRFLTSLGVMAVMTPVIINAIGVETYGQWAIVFAAIGLVSLSDLGFATAAIKFLAEAANDSNRLKAMTGSLLAVYAALTVLCAAIVGMVHYFELMPLETVFLLLGASSVALMATSVHRAYLIALGRQELVDWTIIAGSLAQAILTWVLLAEGMGVLGMALAHCLATVLQALLFVLIAGGLRFPAPAFDAIGEHVRCIAGFSVWALIANVCFMLILRIDPLLIEALLTPAAVALFAIALKVGEQVLLFNKQFSNALLPLISRHQSEDASGRRELLLYATRYLLVFAAPVTLLLAASAEDLLRLWIGPAVSGASLSLSVLSLAALASTTQFNAANVLGMSGHPRFVAMTMLASAALKICLGLILLNVMGIVGAAIASLVAALACESLMNIRRACQETGLGIGTFVIQALMPGLICAIPAALMAVFDAPAESLPEMMARCAVYGTGSLALFGLLFFRQSDRAFFERFMTNKSFTEKGASTCAQSIAS